VAATALPPISASQLRQIGKPRTHCQRITARHIEVEHVFLNAMQHAAGLVQRRLREAADRKGGGTRIDGDGPAEQQPSMRLVMPGGECYVTGVSAGLLQMCVDSGSPSTVTK
jgi:hypothetical protein